MPEKLQLSKEEQETYDSIKTPSVKKDFLETLEKWHKLHNNIEKQAAEITSLRKTLNENVESFTSVNNENKQLKEKLDAINTWFKTVSANHNSATLYHGLEELLQDKPTISNPLKGDCSNWIFYRGNKRIHISSQRFTKKTLCEQDTDDLPHFDLTRQVFISLIESGANFCSKCYVGFT